MALAPVVASLVRGDRAEEVDVGTQGVANGGTLGALTRFARGRFFALLVSLLLLFGLQPFFHDRIVGDFLLDCLLSVVLLSSIWSVGGRRLTTVAALLAAPALVARWMLYVSESALVWTVSASLSTVFAVFVTVVVLSAVLRDEVVTADTICGAICGYFLLGVTWALTYFLLESLAPGSFAFASGLQEQIGQGPPGAATLPFLMYYSFVTLTTLGYGDISPMGHSARMLATLEALVGQLYLAVLIARLVGLHTARAPSPDHS